jgi:hypothetical protein
MLPTLDTEYPVIIVHNTMENNRYDVQGVITGIDLGIEEFFVLHDTMEIKDNSIWDILFKDNAGKTVFLNPRGLMFLNKYVLADIKKTSCWPRLYDVKDKLTGVWSEGWFHQELEAVANPVKLWDNFDDSGRRETKFGRENMIIENQYFKKYKGSWSCETLGQAEAYSRWLLEKQNENP